MNVEGTIFDRIAVERAVVRWEDYGEVLTPVQRGEGVWLKREDWYAPLGYGGVNGGKVRQIVWVLKRYLETKPRHPGVVMGGSVRSPNIGRVAVVAKHFGLELLVVIGSKLETAYRSHGNVRIAANLGASFVRAPAPYNPVLQKVARELASKQGDVYLLEYGLSLEGSDERLEAFYRFSGEQIANLPEVPVWIVPAGSCNTTIALLYAIARRRPPGLRRVVLFGIGPTRIEWFEERLARIERVTGSPIRSLFRRKFEHHGVLAARLGDDPRAPYSLEHHDLHASGYASYKDEMPGKLSGVPLHPVYEGKILRYMRARSDLAALLEGHQAVFWIVGGVPAWAPMEPHLRAHMGGCP
jgi:1-aminocyclopropane-1-carboxylate deaminase/D-cysteine desulfhydrase-like pyridoxal-dependent ACC family enzyme